MVSSSLWIVPNTSGFRSPTELMLHYAEHGNEFGANNSHEYEQFADMFWAEPKPAHVRECRRRLGDIIRFDPNDQTFSVVDNKSVIRTFFKPIPCVAIPAQQRVAEKKAGRCHSYADNVKYFQARCQQW
jgi:hypothetical protein